MAKKAKVRAAAAAAAAEEAAAQETQPGKASVAAAVAVVALALAERLFSRFFPTAGEYEDRRKPGGASPLAPAAEKKACPYEVLGVSKGAPFKDVKRAYYKLSRTYHPDKVKGSATEEEKEAATAKFQGISLAYATLERKEQGGTDAEDDAAAAADDAAAAAAAADDGAPAEGPRSRRGKHRMPRESAEDKSAAAKEHKELERRLRREQQLFVAEQAEARKRHKEASRASAKRASKAKKRSRTEAGGGGAPAAPAAPGAAALLREQPQEEDSNEYNTSIHKIAIACQCNAPTIFASLLAYGDMEEPAAEGAGAGVAMEVERGAGPLHFAAYYGRYEMTELVLTRFAGERWFDVVTRQSDRGEVPLDVARRRAAELTAKRQELTARAVRKAGGGAAAAADAAPPPSPEAAAVDATLADLAKIVARLAPMTKTAPAAALEFSRRRRRRFDWASALSTGVSLTGNCASFRFLIGTSTRMGVFLGGLMVFLPPEIIGPDGVILVYAFYIALHLLKWALWHALWRTLCCAVAGVLAGSGLFGATVAGGVAALFALGKRCGMFAVSAAHVIFALIKHCTHQPVRAVLEGGLRKRVPEAVAAAAENRSVQQLYVLASTALCWRFVRGIAGWVNASLLAGFPLLIRGAVTLVLCLGALAAGVWVTWRPVS